MTAFTIIPAEPQDAKLLSQIAWEAKAHWSYPTEWMRLWEADLRVNGFYIQQHTVIKAVASGLTKGWASLSYDPEHLRWEIGHFWVHPSCMGQGIGKGFYQKMGAKAIGKEPGIPEGRWLPLLKFWIHPENTRGLPAST